MESTVKSRFVALTAAAAVAGAFASAPAYARDQIKIVGSSTVFPYTQAVAEEFTKKTGKKAPVVESTGTGGGFKIFCQGVGVDQADITGASRAMKKSEYDDCVKNGVKDVTEVLLGFDGLSVAGSKKGPDFSVTKTQLYQALSKEVPVDGKLVANPYKNWSDIDKALPNQPILVYGPPPTSGTRDAFVELAMHTGCEAMSYFKDQKKAVDAKAYGNLVKDKCSPMRQDGAFVEAGENDNLIVQRLEADPRALGIFGYSFLFENQDKLKGVKVDGVSPTFDTIADASYGISRPLYLYIKNAHRTVIPGIKEFLDEYASKEALGRGGYLSDRGLTTLSDAKLKETQEAVKAGKNMSAPTS
jgi:phosphate transport system substrate-binding protein